MFHRTLNIFFFFFLKYCSIHPFGFGSVIAGFRMPVICFIYRTIFNTILVTKFEFQMLGTRRRKLVLVFEDQGISSECNASFGSGDCCKKFGFSRWFGTGHWSARFVDDGASIVGKNYPVVGWRFGDRLHERQQWIQWGGTVYINWEFRESWRKNSITIDVNW